MYFSLYHGSGSKKTGWTEEQEEELRTLFMENQNNPSTEKGISNEYKYINTNTYTLKKKSGIAEHFRFIYVTRCN